ncbi:tetratricopeptide repeat protein [Roseivivax sp. THAF197b]|uniref:tetratricopeptide repeat protein n=1 Tax=Roseivivax sp. THAF197b TaxID=2588299 RepID=UPI001267DBDF|nr:tetratricopeptide repeat protein [Roseivivax sp. THAF197b]QFS83484.1 hypothetical protein FIV09_11655 [Roseivivax sp. THAF197b]
MNLDVCRAETDFDDPAALAAWNAMVRAFLAHGLKAPDHLAEVLRLSPNSVLALSAKGLFCLMLGRRELVATAREVSQQVRTLLDEGGAPDRARAYADALSAWLAGHPSGAVFHLDRVLARNPADTLTLKMAHGIRFILGDAPGMRLSVESALAAHDSDHALAGYALGCHAFALEETGAYSEAEKAGRAGLELAADDAWGLHAVTHVFDMTHRPDCGIALIENNTSAWDHCNNFRYHVWWHKALLHLDRGEVDRVLALYDTQIRADKTDDYRDISNATSLLMRLELDGVDCGTRWTELADLAEARLSDGCLVFADMHYMLALSGDQRPGAARQLAARIAGSGAATPETARIASHPGERAARGLAAFGEGQYAQAFADLTAARSHMRQIGGSHAQRDVFERITVDAGIRAGAFVATSAILAERTALRASRPDTFAESRIEAIAEARRNAGLYAAQ